MRHSNNNPQGFLKQLMELPLMKGVSAKGMHEVVGKVPFHFLKFASGETVAAKGEPCTHLRFILSGSVRITLEDPGHQIKVAMTVQGPHVLAPEYLFGRNTSYPATAVAQTAVNGLQITKEDYRRMLQSDPVFLFNYLNTVSCAAQGSLAGVLSIAGGNAVRRLAFWITTLTAPGSTDISICSPERELHSIVGLSAQSLRQAVAQLQSEGMVTYSSPNNLIVSSRAALLPLL